MFLEFINQHSTVFLILGVLIAGSLNTILTKIQDSVCIKDCETDNPIYFQQPILQTLIMFLAEISCWFWWYIHKTCIQKNTIQYRSLDEFSRDFITEHHITTDPDTDNYTEDEETDTDTDFNPELEQYCQLPELLLILPTLCDCMSSTLMNLGLIYISASIFQMLRGSIVIFTGIISTIFLKKRYSLQKWLSLIVIFLGIVVVGFTNDNYDSTYIGIILIILAQIFSASQYVLEEKILVKYNISTLLSVGIEGIFGTIITIILAIIFQGIDVYDSIDGLKQLFSIPLLYITSICSLFTISLSNWFGLCITKNISSTSRSTIDICRTLIIWIVSLSLHWEVFKLLQVVGFSVMICGIILFNTK